MTTSEGAVVGADLSLADLPSSVQELAAVLGLPAALRVVQEWPGLTLYPPRRWDGESAVCLRLAAGLGDSLARQLVAWAHGTPVNVPRCVAAVRRVRDAQIRARYLDLYQGGNAAQILALEYRLTERQIRSIVGTRMQGPGLPAPLARQLSLL